MSSPPTNGPSRPVNTASREPNPPGIMEANPPTTAMATIAVYKYHDCARSASKPSPRSIAQRLVPITTQPQDHGRPAANQRAIIEAGQLLGHGRRRTAHAQQSRQPREDRRQRRQPGDDGRCHGGGDEGGVVREPDRQDRHGDAGAHGHHRERFQEDAGHGNARIDPMAMDQARAEHDRPSLCPARICPGVRCNRPSAFPAVRHPAPRPSGPNARKVPRAAGPGGKVRRRGPASWDASGRGCSTR